MNRVLVYLRNINDYKTELEKYKFSDLEIFYADNREDAEKYLSDVNIILGNPYLTSRIINQAGNIKWVQSVFAGIESLCRTELRKDYTLTGVKNIFGPLMSEYVFGYIMALERNLFTMRDNQKKCDWVHMPYNKLSDLTIGILGFGSIGRHLAETAKHFGMKVYALNRTKTLPAENVKMFCNEEINTFLQDLDYLVITLPATPETHCIINKKTLSQMKKSSTVINIGRGSCINEEDLTNALLKNELKAAVLDVFQKEPLSTSSLLWKMKNVYITPHIAAKSFPEKVVEIFVENYSFFANNLPLKYQIDFAKGY